jgi:ketosteroid isomerase-like protein
MAATLTPDELGDRLVELLEGGDPSVLVEHLAPGAVLWHNDDKQTIDALAGLQAVAGLHALAGDVRIEVVQRAQLPDGFFQRYVIHGTVRETGSPVAAHHCIVVRTADAGIVRIDEYVDPTLLAQLGVAEPKEVSP